MTPMSIVFFAAISLILLIPSYQSADCSKRPSLIALKADGSSDFLDSITAAYNSWNSSVRLGFNNAFTQMRNIITTNTTYKYPADKINALIVVCDSYNKNNPGAKLVLYKVDINGWCGNVTDFVNCGNATNATASSATSTSVAPTTVVPTTIAVTTQRTSTVAASTIAPSTASLPTSVAPPSTLLPTVQVSSVAPSTVVPSTVVPSTVVPSTVVPSTVTVPTVSIAASISVSLPSISTVVASSAAVTVPALSTVVASSALPSVTTPSAPTVTIGSTNLPSSVSISVPSLSTVQLTSASTPALSTSVVPTSAVPSSTPVPPTSALPSSTLCLPHLQSLLPPTTVAITLSTLLASTATPTPANQCQPQPASTASVIFNTADNQIAKDSASIATCSCTNPLSKAFYNSISDPNPFGSAVGAITLTCNDINQFCMCTESGECFTQTGDSLQAVLVYPFCQSTDCHMYAVVSDALDGSVTMQGDISTSYISNSQCTDSSCSAFKDFPDSAYLKPVSAGCDGCASLKQATCLGPLAP
uniref:Uncharacterized protein n=1 Tax=Ditylenchus dipsaci TaxID=166011 RepID=A0A915E9Q0_9BILA